MSTKKEKMDHLRKILSEMGSVLLAYSGGVDSTFLLKVAKEELRDKVVAVTVRSEIYSPKEMVVAEEMTRRFGVKHCFLDIDILTEEEFVKNPKERCFVCKKKIFGQINRMARELRLSFVIDGSHYGDLDDYRPGMKAIRELKVRSPLQEALFDKDDIRFFSKEIGLSTWCSPSNACLATRIPYDDRITSEKLRRIERAEAFLRDLGIRQVRVRYYHNELAKIEVEEKDLSFFLEKKIRKRIVSKLSQLGFLSVSLDLQGYRTGSMNEELKEKVEE